MSLYIKVHEPRASRKALLIGKINSLNALKRCEDYLGAADAVKAKAGEMNATMANIPHDAGGVLRVLPKVEVKSIDFDTGKVKCAYCGKFFSSDKGLYMHINKTHPLESKQQAPIKPASEMDHIESQIAALEREINLL